MSFMDFLAISGSLRPESSNTALLRAAQALVPPGLRVTLYEGLAGLPPFDPGLEPEEAPGPVQAFRDQIRAAEGVIICTPEYAHGMPGILKNALEWTVASGEFVDKPVAALSSSPAASGGEKALAWLIQTLAVMSAHILPEVSQPIPFGRSRVKSDGEIVDPALAVTLRAILDGLARAVEGRAKHGSQS
jgi:NAD(P)H-dependent FMN reductase